MMPREEPDAAGVPAGAADVPADPVRLARVQEQPLDVAAVLAVLTEPSSGGLACFVGRVRDHDEGARVVGLDYTAHPTATERLHQVCTAVATGHGVPAVAAAHRVGELAVGEPTVVVAAVSGHRDDAFTATRALIDTLKQQVPIWKHQRFADGSGRWVGSP